MEHRFKMASYTGTKTTMRTRSPHQRQQELGDFVRAQREKLDPAASGVPAGGRRRTPGLRREEVAQLCGLSVTWYTWLEQGREISLSPTALARLADALRLDRAQRAYLFELAGKRDPDDGVVEVDKLPAPVTACIKAIRAPAYVLERTWTARAWNNGAERLFLGWLTPSGERNLLRFIFLEPTARSLISDYEERARRVVAEFRADVSSHLDDAIIRELVDGLRLRANCLRASGVSTASSAARAARGRSIIRRKVTFATSRSRSTWRTDRT
jgi:transcriptional regulator with XRE-family HTH domain